MRAFDLQPRERLDVLFASEQTKNVNQRHALRRSARFLERPPLLREHLAPRDRAAHDTLYKKRRPHERFIRLRVVLLQKRETMRLDHRRELAIGKKRASLPDAAVHARDDDLRVVQQRFSEDDPRHDPVHALLHFRKLRHDLQERGFIRANVGVELKGVSWS
eukprot:31028-Pelagococcus_subviridis.AAC.8